MNKYKQSGEISERLVLNHLIVILNVFGNEAGIEMLANRIELEHWNALKPFLIFLRAIKYDEITGIEMDKYVISKLRELKWES